jgi:Kef-type K+ transport system membrane component KefB
MRSASDFERDFLVKNMNDLRNPIGLFFALVGLMLAFEWRETAPLTSAPVNLYVGATMVLFGVVMVWLARRKS